MWGEANPGEESTGGISRTRGVGFGKKRSCGGKTAGSVGARGKKTGLWLRRHRRGGGGVVRCPLTKSNLKKRRVRKTPWGGDGWEEGGEGVLPSEGTQRPEKKKKLDEAIQEGVKIGVAAREKKEGRLL